MTRLDVAVLGVGNRAQDHLETIGRLAELCRLVAVCDADAERAAEVGTRYDAPGFTDLERMLAEARPELLYVITPPDSHHAAVEVAGRHGVHVVSETPIATTLPLADAMIAAARRHGIKLEVAENVWRWPNERLKRRIIEAGLIGEVTQVHLWYYSGSYHGISAARTLIGSEPVRVRGYARETPVPPHRDRAGHAHTSGPYEHGLVEFAGGALCVYQYPLHPHYRNYWDVIGTEGAIVGTDLILMRGGERQFFPIRQELDESSAVPALVRAAVETDPPISWENPYRELPIGAGADEIGRADILAGMRRAILDDTEPAYGAVNARADQEVLIALRESARRDGAWVDLPLTSLTGAERELHEEYARRYGHDPLGDIEAVIRTQHPRNTPAELARLRYYSGERHG
ncbi:MAG: Gfo/Idh/MocA family oxidoreductase [Chloroflexota bacterium]|nr:Gfo/Idh/MocA family oxidoreductase [Chloroflexota bacterium]